MAILTSTGITFGDATTQSTAATAFAPSGTVMLFVQTAAPTGWTKSTTHNDKALRVVSGSVTTGGSVAFTTAFGTPAVSGSVSVSGTVGNHTLTTAELAAHSHGFTAAPLGNAAGTGGPGRANTSPCFPTTTFNTNNAGSGSSHNHSFSGSGSLSSATATINVSYVDVIIATKN
jgi:hypothetical protein